MKFVSLFFFLVLAQLSFTQSELQQKEARLNESLLKLRSAKTDEEMDRLNIVFKKEMEAFLKSEGAFDYPFTLLKTIAVLDSEDELVRIINWNIEYTDFSYSYGGFVLKKEEGKEKVTVTELIDKLDPYAPKPEGIIDAKNWYGALYYKIIPFGHHGKTEYLLIGWDGGTTGSNFKLMDVLTFSGNTPKFGSPVFKANRTTLKRVVYEYSNLSNMSMRFDPKNGRVVFDHLSPESPVLEGVYSYYIPDMSYDCYRYDYDAENWVLQEDVIMTNPDDKNVEKSFYSLNSRTGKVEKNRMNADWISPKDEGVENNGTHVARTENTPEDQMTTEDLRLPKVRLFSRRHKNPEMMPVGRGKKKSKNYQLMQLGRINQLTIKRFAPPGAYLIDLQDNEVLLPNKYILPEHEEGSVVDVFVMKDSENRIVCTTEVPLILLGECRYLEVIHVNPYGAFVDWGLDKDLLVPFSEQLHRLEQEEKYLFTLRYDFETDRLFGSMKVRKVLDLCEDQEMVGQAVDLLICEEGKLGRNVIVNNRYEGLIFKNQQSKILERGQEMKGYVSVVRPDGKLDIRLEPITFEKYDEASQFILDELTKVKVLPLSDRSSPEEIREQLGMSKKTFKQAIGKLYRWKKITIKDDSIELNG